MKPLDKILVQGVKVDIPVVGKFICKTIVTPVTIAKENKPGAIVKRDHLGFPVCPVEALLSIHLIQFGERFVPGRTRRKIGPLNPFVIFRAFGRLIDAPISKGMQKELPLKHLISFDKYLRHYDDLAINGSELEREYAGRILKIVAPYPELREGFADISLLDARMELIKTIVADAFAGVLGDNEIKAISLPYYNVLFNPTRRLKKILDAAGPGYEPLLMSQEEGFDYIMAATVILNFYYGYQLDYSRPYMFEIPDGNGVLRYYRIMYNAEFMEILPTEHSPEITQDDVDQLLSRPNDLDFWKQMIPPDSFQAKGFVIANMFDVTNEYAISAIKSKLIGGKETRQEENFFSELRETFRSFFKLEDLDIGFISYNKQRDQFEKIQGERFKSFILREQGLQTCDRALCEAAFEKLLRQKTYFVVPDVEKYLSQCVGEGFYEGLIEQGIGSAIFAPISDGGELLGVLELVSPRTNVLNGVNATKLDDVMPYIAGAIVRSKIEEENLVDAIIQNKYTTIHPSVQWKFREEAKRYIRENRQGHQTRFQEISFAEVYPLYGQVDIKKSSQARNEAVQRDLLIQLSGIRKVMDKAIEKLRLPIYEELIFRVDQYMKEVNEVLHTNSEQGIFNFVQQEIVPVFRHIKSLDPELAELVGEYESGIDPQTHSYYDHRKNYDQSVHEINQSLASLLDERQEDAQRMYPHYYERFKTDGVEHNMYVGDSISGDRPFDKLYLQNLRLWQLQVMVEMENAHYNLKPSLQVPLDVSSLIMVHNSSLGIRFRMDEKRFDVDGTYNARYEVIKKRIDKSYIKGTRERLTQPGKMVIVYSQKKDELEYLRYIAFLKSKGYFNNNVEIVELEALQGVSGLKAIRVEILYRQEEDKQQTYTYEDLMEELRS
jgi:hypothetical protein